MCDAVIEKQLPASLSTHPKITVLCTFGWDMH